LKLAADPIAEESRPNMQRAAVTSKLAWWSVVAGLALLMGGCGQRELERLRDVRPLMGTVLEVSVEGPDPTRLKEAVDDAYAEMARLSDMMNHYNPGSVVSAINSSAGRKPVAIPPELMVVLQMAQTMSGRSHGAFDVTIGSLSGWRFDSQNPGIPTDQQVARQRPLVNFRNLVLDPAAGTAFLKFPGMRIDLGGIAKLYILDAGMRVLVRRGIEHAMINGGGDVNVLGTIQGHPWRVGIRDPRAPEKLLAVLELTQGFVASSGDYERYVVKNGKRLHHIIDPRTGRPTEGPHGVTIVSEDLAQANGLSAAVMVLGSEAGRELIRQSATLEGLIVDRDGSVWMSPGLNKRLRFIGAIGGSVQ
jgi:FAD:protein FMN transferase